MEKVWSVHLGSILLTCILGAVSGYTSGSTYNPRNCLDVAVVGGGIGGTYTGYRLRRHGKRISIFEITDRIGGRMFTAKLPTVDGVNVDFGAMRFQPTEHLNLVNILNEVGLPIVDFPLNFGNSNETVYYLRGRHLRSEELGGPRTPYNLRPDERLSPSQLMWKLFTENTNMSRIRYPPEELEDEVYSIVTKHGIPLYTLTLDNFYSRYASREAYNYLRDTSVRSSTVGQYGAHLALPSLPYPGTEKKSRGLKTIQGGFDRLPKTLLYRFLRASRKHRVYLNHQLMAIEGQRGYYRLRFSSRRQINGKTGPAVFINRMVCAKKVVLALQRDSVERIDFLPFRQPHFIRRLNSVIDDVSEKIFLAYPFAWWKRGNADITHARTNVPTGFTYDWRTGTNGYVIHLPSFTDGVSSVALWRHLQGLGRTIYGSLPGDQRVSTEVRRRIHTYMSRIYRIPESEIPGTVGGGMQLWDRFPFAAAWSFYKPGCKMAETRDFILKPFGDHDVFIVGNSWWPNPSQTWAESTLKMVELFLKRYTH